MEARGLAPAGEQSPRAPPADDLVDAGGRLLGALWPIRVAPQRDELLSSWIARIAASYSALSHPFLYAIWPGPGSLPADLDTEPPHALLGLLAEKTGVARERIDAMPLTEELRDWRLLSAPGHDEKAPIRTTLYCSACLSADEMPYLRRTWRLACVTLCIRHRRTLTDRCSVCASAVTLPGIGPEVCEGCGHDRRRAEPADEVRGVEVRAQQCINRALAGQEIEIPALGPIRPLSYLNYLYDLVRLLAGGSSAQVLWPDLCARYGLPYILPEFSRAAKVNPTWLDLEDRRHAITLAVHVLADWPVGFAEALLALDLWASEHVWRGVDPLWTAVRTYYETNALAAQPPSFRPRRPYSSDWQL